MVRGGSGRGERSIAESLSLPRAISLPSCLLFIQESIYLSLGHQGPQDSFARVIRPVLPSRNKRGGQHPVGTQPALLG